MQLAGEWPRKPDWGGAGTWYFAPLASDPVRAGWIGDGKRGRLYRSSSEAVARREQFCESIATEGGRLLRLPADHKMARVDAAATTCPIPMRRLSLNRHAPDPDGLAIGVPSTVDESLPVEPVRACPVSDRLAPDAPEVHVDAPRHSLAIDDEFSQPHAETAGITRVVVQCSVGSAGDEVPATDVWLHQWPRRTNTPLSRHREPVEGATPALDQHALVATVEGIGKSQRQSSDLERPTA
jgi:hypothetical protein